MSDTKATTTVTITNRAGVHLRSALEITKRVAAYDAKVWLINTKTQVRAEAWTLLDIIMLVAAAGDELTLEATGADAQRAVDELADFIANHLHEFDD
jgi:phosphotransferase system HPr (HPr) family protein